MRVTTTGFLRFHPQGGAHPKPPGITKKNLPEHIPLNLYAMAIQARYGKLPERAMLFFLKDTKLGDSEPAVDSLVAFSEKPGKLVAGILALEFPARPAYQRCGWCPYGDLCESRETAD